MEYFGARFLMNRARLNLEAGLTTQAQNSVKKVLNLAALQRPTLAVSDAYWMPTLE